MLLFFRTLNHTNLLPLKNQDVEFLLLVLVNTFFQYIFAQIMNLSNLAQPGSSKSLTYTRKDF